MISHWLWSCSFCDLRLVQLPPQRTPFLDLDGFVDGDLAGRRRRIHIWHRASSLSAVVNFAARIAAGTFNFGLTAMSLRVTATRESTAVALPDMLRWSCAAVIGFWWVFFIHSAFLTLTHVICWHCFWHHMLIKCARAATRLNFRPWVLYTKMTTSPTSKWSSHFGITN